MLDGILGRGFGSKCKSFIKAVRARIEVVRRRAEAKQRFLKEDLAKLLLNGLDINAYGRTEEFLAGSNLLSCYDFIEKSCEHVLKQLSRIDRQGDCPEECREAVASLMFAAARFSDLPELRDLRDLFQERYGNCLQVFVNQTFTEKLSSRPPALAKKRLQVLHDITSEFSIKWDSKGFEKRMSTASVQVDDKKMDVVQRNEHLDVKNKIESPGPLESVNQRQKSLLKGEESNSRGNGFSFRGRQTLSENSDSSHVRKHEKLKTVTPANSSHSLIQDGAYINFTKQNNGHTKQRTGEKSELSSRNKHFIAKGDEDLKYEMLISSPHVKISDNEKNGCHNERSSLEILHRGREEESDRSKTSLQPYVKAKDSMILPPPYTKPKEDEQRSIMVSVHIGSDCDENAINPYYCNNGIGGEEQFTATAELKHHDSEKIPLPKPRSIRRKNQKSSSSNNGIEDGSVKRSSNSRRKGLQTMFDEEHHRSDDEERMIDKLLIHYCKKPSNYDGETLKKRLHVESSSSAKSEVVPLPTSSVSLPHEQIASPESEKTLNRSKTFQPDNQARHVHPKLPDYDDLAARFASLKQR